MLSFEDVLRHAEEAGLLKKPYSFTITPMSETDEDGQELYSTQFCSRPWSNYCTLEEVDDEIEEIDTYRKLFSEIPPWIPMVEKKPPHNEWVLLSVKDRVLLGKSYTHPSCATMYETVNNCHIFESDIDAWLPRPISYAGGDK